jgi:hypothetical protein
MAGLCASAQNFRGSSVARGRVVNIGQPHRYVMFIGQSNAGGMPPAISLTQPYRNKTWVGGSAGGYWPDWNSLSTSINSLVPLVEGINVDRESPCAGFANQVSAWARTAGYGAEQDSIVASFGVGGQAYSGLKLGTLPYSNSIASVTRIRQLIGNATVPALLSVHGESDGPCGYEQKVQEWQSDYETSIKAITGQSGIIPIFSTQVQDSECSSGNYHPGFPDDGTDYGMLAAHENRPTLTPVVGPRYVFPVYDASGVHLAAASYQWMGEYYAKAYWKQCVLGQQWSPLRPISLSSSGNVITITFTGFVAPLVFDTTNVSNPGNYGFEYGGAETISSVAITDATNGVVQLTMSGNVTLTANRLVRYAHTGGPYGPTTGARGCLRDSDSTVGLSGNHLYNWCVHFAKGVMPA